MEKYKYVSCQKSMLMNVLSEHRDLWSRTENQLTENQRVHALPLETEKTVHPEKNMICLSHTALPLAQRHGSMPTKNWDVIPLLLSWLFLFL